MLDTVKSISCFHDEECFINKVILGFAGKNIIRETKFLFELVGASEFWVGASFF